MNVTDTVVTRGDAHFVDHGPYRFVRNPMYTGVLMAAIADHSGVRKVGMPLRNGPRKSLRFSRVGIAPHHSREVNIF
jgi:hypothetical protein